MMPSVVKVNPAVGEGGSTRNGGVRKQVTSTAPRNRSQLLVSSESSHSVKSVEQSGVTASVTSSRSLKLTDRSARQKVDSATAAAAASATSSRVVAARNPAARNTRQQHLSSGPAKSVADNRDVLKTFRASGAVARPSPVTTTTTAHRKSVVEPSRHEDSSASANKRKSVTNTASSTSCSSVKLEVSSVRSHRVAAVSQTKSNCSATSVATKKPQLKQVNGNLATTSRASVKQIKRSNASSAVVERSQSKAKSSAGKNLASVSTSRLTKSTSVAGSEATESDSVLQQSLPSVDTSDSLHADCVGNESSKEISNDASHKISNINSESPPCELLESNMCYSEHDLVPVAFVDENGSDLEETNICDVSLSSCRSGSLFYSAHSSVIGSASDMKHPSVIGLLENDSVAVWSGSNSVSMESLQSSAGYCTPGEHDDFCEVADCTLSNTVDPR